VFESLVIFATVSWRGVSYLTYLQYNMHLPLLHKNSPKAYDQVALLHIWNQNQNGDTKCRVVQMKKTKKHLVFPTEGKMRTLMEKDRSYPTFVHVTNNQRAGKIPDDVQNAFYAKVLELTDQERNSISSLLGKMIKGSA